VRGLLSERLGGHRSSGQERCGWRGDGGRCPPLSVVSVPVLCNCSLLPPLLPQFFSDFASAFAKLLELGVPFPEGAQAV